MNIYKKISDKITYEDVRTITVDIFDTVLLRDIHPENYQFRIVAERWLPLFNKTFSKKITADEILLLRLYSRDELFAINYAYNIHTPVSDSVFDMDAYRQYDVTLESWFETLIGILSQKYKTKLSSTETKSIVKKMIKVELTTEKECLEPNVKLINALKRIKKIYKDTKIYFVSDMYLSSEDINELLNYFGIDIFDGGVTSSEAGYTKWSGSLFTYLHTSKIFGENFDLSYNLHIGDSKQSDFDQPIANGSNAILYKSKLKTDFFYRVSNKINYKNTVKLDKSTLKDALKTDDYSPRNVYRLYGLLFSQALYPFLCHVGLSAKYSPKTTFLMVSSEARLFKKYGDLLMPDYFKSNNLKVADKLNRRRMIRALVWYLANNKTEHNIESLISIIKYGEVEGSRREIYEFFFGDKYPYSELTINLRSDEEFYAAFLDEIKEADAKYTKPLKEAFDYVSGYLPKNNHEIVVVDLGWGGTVQALFADFVKCLGFDAKVKGLYLGAHPADRFAVRNVDMTGYLLPNVRDGKDRPIWNAVLWEYAFTSKVQFNEDFAHIDNLQKGILAGLDLFRKINLDPYGYFQNVSRQEIQKFISKPSRKIVKILGKIQFDTGFVDYHSFRIVNMSLGMANIRMQIIRHPRTMLRKEIFGLNHWAAGYFAYYRLHTLRFLIRLAELIKRRKYI